MRLRGFGGRRAPIMPPARRPKTSRPAFRCRLSLDKAWAEANIRLDFIAGLARALRRVADIDGDIGGAACRRPNASSDVLRRAALLFDRRGDRACDLGDALDGLADRAHRFLGRKLHAGDLAGNFLGRLGDEALDLLATMAKPRPASPALAASIVAFSANRWSARRSK
jgi:hypothetical protein